MEPRRSSTPQSDTDSEEEEDDEHDLTPCNPSPNVPFLFGLGRIPDQNDIEEGWRTHVQKVISRKKEGKLKFLRFFSFHRLMTKLTTKPFS